MGEWATHWEAEATRLKAELDRVMAALDELHADSAHDIALVMKQRNAAMADAKRLRELLEAVRNAGPSPELRKLFKHYGYEPEVKP